jgi:glucose-1-phosphate cytidylyltransferase
MKVVILAGGLGTRIAEEGQLRPKPLIEIGGRPILWHIMKAYGQHGLTDFIICLGFRGTMIKEFFANFHLNTSDLTVDLGQQRITYEMSAAEPWRVTLVDTGELTETGGRIRRIRRFVENDSMFCLTYGDGLSDVDITGLVKFHQDHGGLATVTAVEPPGRFGVLQMDGELVTAFTEKPKADGGLISGGFFVLSPKAIDYIDGDTTAWERAPMEALARERQLRAFHHRGFWHPMDSARDRLFLENLWASGQAPWKTWA